MNSKAAAEAAGIPAETLRYYERCGVLPEPPRRPNGYRDYTAEHITVIELARALRQLDLPLREVRAIVRVAHDGVCGELRAALTDALEGLVEEADRRIEAMQRSRQQMVVLRDGLRRMEPRDESVPGVTPCECVEALRTT